MHKNYPNLFTQTKNENDKNNENICKFKDFSLDDMKKFIYSEFNSFPTILPSRLEDFKGNLKRSSGLFNSWISCTIFITKDKYLHIFDMENDYNPVFTFDLIRTTAKRVEDKEKQYAFEIIEMKKKLVVGTAPSSKILRFACENESELNKFIELINTTNNAAILEKKN